MTPLQRFCLLLADAVLVIHVAFVAFVVVGLLGIWVGWFRGWDFVRRFWFRIAHLTAIGLVTAESVAGWECPLTTWENRLRLLAGGEQRYQGSFIQHWLHRVLFFDCNENTFALIYAAFLLLVVFSLWWVPPRWPHRGP